MKRTGRRAILLGLVCLLLVHSTARLCMAAPPPDSTRAIHVDSLQAGTGTSPVQIERLRARLRGVARVRILTRGASLLADATSVSSEGLLTSNITMRGGFGYQTVTKPRLIPWAEIESIQVHQGHATRNGALIGGLAGTLIGIAISAHQPCTAGTIFGGPGNCGERQIPPIWEGTLGGALVGALVGSRHDHWRPIYP